MQRIAITQPRTEDLPPSEVVEFVQRVDELGYEALWVPESWGREAFVTLALLACNTKRLRLGTGIVNVFSRTPALIAQAAALYIRATGPAMTK